MSKEINEILDKYVSNYNLDVLGFRESGRQKVTQAIEQHIKREKLQLLKEVLEKYSKGEWGRWDIVADIEERIKEQK